MEEGKQADWQRQASRRTGRWRTDRQAGEDGRAHCGRRDGQETLPWRLVRFLSLVPLSLPMRYVRKYAARILANLHNSRELPVASAGRGSPFLANPLDAAPPLAPIIMRESVPLLARR